MAKRWYSVSVLSNFEKKIAEAIRAKAEEKGLSDQIDEVLVPTEEVIEVRRHSVTGAGAVIGVISVAGAPQLPTRS